VVEHRANKLLFQEGDPPESIIAVCSGVVRLFSSRSDGSISVFQIVRTGDLLGLPAALLNQPYAFSAETLTRCQLRFLKRSAFLAILDAEPGLRKETALEGARRHYATQMEVKKSPLGRLLELLIGFCEILQEQKAEPTTHRVRMTVQELADYAGVTDRWMRTWLARLKAKGLITRERGWLLVLDPERLRELYEEIR
jgi:CRP-like cAMP-binding protein